MSKRKFFLTINNYSEAEWLGAVLEISKCQYGICCKEVGTEKNVPHIHVWLHYENARTFTSINKKFPRANIQEGKGRDSDQVYLKKDGAFVEHGTMEKQGKRNDIDTVKKIIKSGGSMVNVVDSVSSFQAIRGAELILKYYEPTRPIKPIKVFWFWGRAGSGKTKRVFDTEVDIFIPTSHKWWEGYDKHKVVLVDDWRPSWCSFENLLKLTDIYPFRVETKGGSRQTQYDTIYFTSHQSPREYFSEHTDDEYEQLNRRITYQEEF